MEDNTENSLAAHVGKATERKEIPNPISSPSGTGAENFWGADDDISPDEPFVPPARNKKVEIVEENPAPVKTITATPVVVFSESVAALSAKNAVSAMDFTQRLLLTPIANWKAKKAMRKINEDLEELEIVIDTPDKDLEPDGLRQKKAFERLSKKISAIHEGIAMTPAEKADSEETFKTFMVHTQKSLPPSMGIWMNILGTTGKRAVDLIFD